MCISVWISCSSVNEKKPVGVVLVSSLWYRTQSGWEDRATAGAPVHVGATESCVCVWSTAILSPASTDATLFLFHIITADFSLQSCTVVACLDGFLVLSFFLWIICGQVCSFSFLFKIKSVSELRGKMLPATQECVPLKIFSITKCQAGNRNN